MGTAALIRGSLNKALEIGYSCSGQIVEVGSNIDHLHIGDFVACAGASIANHAEYICVPKHLVVKLQSKQNLKHASLTTIGAIAMQGIRRANPKLGEHVCVFGLGLIGQITVQLAKLSGCKVFGIDIDDSRLFLAQKLGCDHVYNAREQREDTINNILFHTQHHGVDATIITAASRSGDIIQQSMEITRKKGKVVLVGDVDIQFNRTPFYQKEIDFLISCSYGPGRYDKQYEMAGHDYPYSFVRWTENRNMQLVANLIQEKKLNIEPLVSREFNFVSAGNAYEMLGQKQALGLVLKYQKDETKDETKEPSEKPTDVVLEEEIGPIASAKSYERPQKRINVGFIGAGGFAKVKLLPLVSKVKQARIKAIIDTNPANAINIAEQYGAESYDNDYKKVLQNSDVHAVVIATPHAFHAQQSIDALTAGKAVFVEKPAAVTDNEYRTLKTFLTLNKHALYCVDFNRSFAPFITKIKTVVEHRTTPLIIHYRMNAGFIAKDHWVQSKHHGGRIIGEACHIFELFTYLTNAQPVTISTNRIDTNRHDLGPTDNFSVQISFDDGSICSLLYTAIGNTELAKEQMELFFDGKSIVMDDYKTLRGYGLSRSFNRTIKTPDKGHKTLVTHFFDAARRNRPSPIPVNRILLATKISLQVNDMIRREVHAKQNIRV